ncbi:MAG TPA: Asp-tRNA(Asn)/Glu-tRNA(Gln) amidotransferase subunit GatA [Saprospiraceae bacterium]|nr:Asp-tRNA(Asn)/Glu-tRNA(Gln) amidotransferase subunit GatA [Saprospiraceae bacterium]
MYTSIHSLHIAIKEGKTSFKSQVQFHIDKIIENKETNAFIHVFAEEALNKAKHLDTQLASGELQWQRLTGVCISLKDNICYKDHPCSAGSKILEGYHSPFNATAVQKLLDEGAIIIGMTNCDQFGMGSTSQNSHYGAVKNGANLEMIAGGSSGGAAVSVQIGACIIALGSDTGGSVRQPAAFTDTIGFKPSYGAVSRYGLIAYGSSFDQIGIIGTNYEDIETLFDLIRGIDVQDSTTTSIEQSKNLIRNHKPKIAYIPEMFVGNGAWMDTNRKALEQIKEKIDLIPFDFEYMNYLVPTYYILSTAEASSNLSRFDGVRYGYRAENVKDLQDMYVRSRSEGFGTEVKKRIMIGTFVLSEGYFDAYFTKALKIRQLLVNKVNEILAGTEGIIMPISTSGPWLLNEKITDPTQIYLSDVYTVLANLVGMPCITVPLRWSDDSAANSISLQIMNHKNCDKTIFNLAQLLIN